MSNSCDRFHFVKDMNGDFVFSISDVWLMIEYIWLLPVKVAVNLAHNHPPMATFFEIDCSTGESWGGGISSLFLWIIILVFYAWVLDTLEAQQ